MVSACSLEAVSGILTLDIASLTLSITKTVRLRCWIICRYCKGRAVIGLRRKG